MGGAGPMASVGAMPSVPGLLDVCVRRAAPAGAAVVGLIAAVVLPAAPASAAGTSAVDGAAPGPAPGAAAITAAHTPYPAPGQPLRRSAAEPSTSTVEKDGEDLRVATLDAGLTDRDAETLLADLRTGDDAAAGTVAATAQSADPDVLVLTGVTYDEEEAIARTLNSRYLSVGQDGRDGLRLRHVYTEPTNSGLGSGADLDGDGRVGGPGDALGWGAHPGQLGMVVFSTEPIDEDAVRTVSEFRWQDLPAGSMPETLDGSMQRAVARLTSTSLWDIPLEVGDGHLHLIATASTGVRSDRPVDALRAVDERRLLADYVSEEPGSAWYLTDDEGRAGGLAADEPFVVAGAPATAETLSATLADADDDSGEELGEDSAQVVEEAAAERVLLDAERLQDPEPEAVTDQPVDERPDALAGSDPLATRFLADGEDLRASYVLPDAELSVEGAGIFWPAVDEFGFELVDPLDVDVPQDRLVWTDIARDSIPEDVCRAAE